MANQFSPTGLTVKVTIASSGTPVSGTLASTSNVVRVANSGTDVVFVKMNGATAAATDIPVLPGATEVFQFGTAAVSCLGKSATSCDVYFTPGEGE